MVISMTRDRFQSPSPTATPSGAAHRPSWPLGLEGLAYGGDYNPEQWTRQTWVEDVRLMREAGVNLVSIGMFSWASLEPRRGEFHWEWLDEVFALLPHAARNAMSVVTHDAPYSRQTPTASSPWASTITVGR